jgi:hypothetical protein
MPRRFIVYVLMFLWMHKGADVFTAHYFLQVANGIHIEYDDRQFVFLAHASCGQVHHF